MIGTLLDNVREKRPVVHCITNYVTANDCANILLALGASPVMADGIDDVIDITPKCDALCINIGTLKRDALPAMQKAGELANLAGKPVVLDPTGVGASRFRLEAARLLTDKIKFSAIRGNASEIKALCGLDAFVPGVDAVCDGENDAANAEYCRRLSGATGAVVIMTGETDIISTEKHFYRVFGGSPLMSRVTGTGCMLTAVTAAFLGANTAFEEACLAAVGLMAVCGETAEKQTETGGTMTFRNRLIDGISVIDAETFERGVRFEIGNFEALRGN